MSMTMSLRRAWLRIKHRDFHALHNVYEALIELQLQTHKTVSEGERGGARVV